MSVFFTSRKTSFKSWLNTSSIPPWYLAAYQDSSAFSYCIPNSFSILDGSIENGSASSIASRHWVDRLSFCSWFWWVVPRYLLDTSAVDDHFSTPSSTGVSLPLDTYICRDTLLALFKLLVRSRTHFIRYLSWYFSIFSPNLLISLKSLFLKDFFKLFQYFLLLVSILSFHIHAFHVLKPRFWGFSKWMSYYWNFGMGFNLNEFKTSYITSH